MSGVPVAAVEDADSRGVIFFGKGAKEANEADFVVDLEVWRLISGRFGKQLEKVTLSSGRDAILQQFIRLQTNTRFRARSWSFDVALKDASARN